MASRYKSSFVITLRLETLSVGKCFMDFTGCFWNINRVINDNRQSKKFIYTGQCEISDGRYFENGEIISDDGKKSLSSKSYIWKPTGHGIDSYFDDGLFFHRIDLTCLMPTANHLCGEDHYEVGYDFKGWPQWGAKWCVQGPRKDYEMYSNYSKL